MCDWLYLPWGYYDKVLEGMLKLNQSATASRDTRRSLSGGPRLNFTVNRASRNNDGRKIDRNMDRSRARRLTNHAQRPRGQVWVVTPKSCFEKKMVSLFQVSFCCYLRVLAVALLYWRIVRVLLQCGHRRYAFFC